MDNDKIRKLAEVFNDSSLTQEERRKKIHDISGNMDPGKLMKLRRNVVREALVINEEQEIRNIIYGEKAKMINEEPKVLLKFLIDKLEVAIYKNKKFALLPILFASQAAIMLSGMLGKALDPVLCFMTSLLLFSSFNLFKKVFVINKELVIKLDAAKNVLNEL